MLVSIGYTPRNLVKPLKRYQYEQYAVLCQLAYPRVFKHTRYGFDPTGHRTIRNRHGKIMVRILWSKQSDEVVVVFKGSHSLSDWLLNFHMWPKCCSDMGLDYWIHTGFYSLIHQESSPSRNNDTLGDTLLQRIEKALVPLINEGKRIAFTGHSSGGAIACVIADYIDHCYPKSVKRVVTFGQPAIGGWRFKQHYTLAHKTYRICCDIDVVTFLPPLPFVYWHTGKTLWLYNGRIYENTPTLWRLGRSIIGWIIRPFTYHMMSKYIRNKDFFDER